MNATPHLTRRLGAVNADLLDRITDVYRICQQLAENGASVLRVTLAGDLPVIRCKPHWCLRGEVVSRTGQANLRATERGGCRIEWEERR